MTLVLYFAAASLGGVDELNAKTLQQMLSTHGIGASGFTEFFARYQTALFALVLPLMMLATRVAWPRSGRTLAEHLILNTYLFSAQMLIMVPLTLVGAGLGLAGLDGHVTMLHGIAGPILGFSYAVWMMATFFSGSRIWSAIRAIAIQLFMVLVYWVIVLAVFLLWTKLASAAAT